MRIAFETLEPRLLLSADPLGAAEALADSAVLAYQAPLSADASTYTLRFNAGSGDLELLEGDSLVASRALAETSAVVIRGEDGLDDALTVDFNFGGFFALDGGIQFHGGAGGIDLLSVVGGDFVSATHTATSTGPGRSGSLAYDDGAQPALVIGYTDLEPIDMSGSTITSLVFNLPGTDDQAILEDDGVAGNGISQIRSRNAVPTFETTLFSSTVTSLTVNLGGDSGFFTVAALPDYVNRALTINGQAGADTVSFLDEASFSSLNVTVGGAVSATSLAIGSGGGFIAASAFSAGALGVAGTLNVNAEATLGTVSVGGSNGVATLNLNGVSTIGSLSVTGPSAGGNLGGLGGSGDVTLLAGGAHSWNSGGISGSGVLRVAEGATLTVSGGNHFLNGRPIVNDGRISWTGGVIDINATPSFVNRGVLELAAGSTFGDVFGPNGTMVLTNTEAGRIVQQTGNNLFGVRMTVNNQGTLEALAGSVSLGGNGGMHTGSFTAAAGATLGFSGTHNFDPGSSVTVAGTLAVSAGVVNLDTDVNLSGAISVTTGGTANLAPASGSILPSGISVSGTNAVLNLAALNEIAPASVTIANAGTANLNSAAQIGALSVAGGGTSGTVGGLGGSGAVTLLAGGAHVWTSGNLSGAGALNVSAGATLTVNGATHILNAKPIVNQGRVHWTAGLIDLNGDGSFANQGELAMAANNVFGNALAPNGTMVITNTGRMLQQGLGASSLLNTSVVNQASGLIEVASGTLVVGGALAQNGTVEVAAGATLRRLGGFTNSGLLSGNGTIDVGAANSLSNAGIVAPGAHSGDTTGTLTITGHYVQESTGRLEIELASAAAGDFDALAVTGTASLSDGAALHAELADGFMPAAGERFRFMSFASRSGFFGGTDLPLHAFVDQAEATGLELVTANVAPQAADDAYTTEEETPLTVAGPGVLGNDADGNQDPLSVVLVDGPANGVLELNADGSFTYVPDADFFGLDSFTYRASDGDFASGVASVFLTVSEGNQAPVANPDSFLLDEDGTLTIPAPGILGNDTDAEGAALSAIVVGTTANGTLTTNADGSFTYTPNSNFNGTDSFTYRASDGEDDSDLATVTLTVNAVNDAPLANPDAFGVDEDGTLAAGVLGNDTDTEDDALSATLESGPANGSLEFNADGSFAYRPNANFSGTDSFTYRASDGVAESETTVTISVGAVNDAPAAAADSFEVDGTLTVAAPGVLANDTDVDGGALTATLLSSTENGALVFNEDGSFTYTANAGFSGTDSFTYRASDGGLDSEPVTVTLTVAGQEENDAPMVDAGPDQVVGLQDVDDHDWWRWWCGDRPEAEVTINALFDDLDLDDTHTATINWGDGRISSGRVLEPTQTDDGVVNGTHEYKDAGVYTVTVTVRDSEGNVTSDTLKVTVRKPIEKRNFDANGDDYRLNEDSVLTVNAAHGVLDNDRGPLGAAIAVRVVEGPDHGVLVLNADGSFTYRPDANFHGQDSFWYEFTDGANVSRAVEVDLCVKDVPERPRACIDWGDQWKTPWNDCFQPFGKRWR
jgi:VCBS repeat-containing protein